MRILCVPIAVLLACASLPQLAVAQWWNPQAQWQKPGEPAPNIVYTGAHIELASVAIQNALQSADFKKLERMHEEFLALEQSGGNGRHLLPAFERAFQSSFPRQDAQVLKKVFSDWNAALPQSGLRRAAEAWMWHTLAWKARGGGFASEVSPEAFKLFRSHLERAARGLQESQAPGKASPLWYSAAIAVAGSLGETPAVLDGMFDEGAKRFPRHLPIYSARLNYLLPQWGGDYARVDDFIRAAVRRTQGTEGTVFYKTLYARVHESYHGSAFFRETKASWRLMKHAFLDELAQAPSDDTLNAFAAMACIAQDRETTAQVLAELGTRANLGAGMQDVSTEVCQEFAKGGR